MMTFQPTFDFIADVLDEIALEGLDGITLNALWTRVAHHPGFSITLDENSKAFLWNAISIHPELDFYQLPKPRPLLTLFNRYNHRDPETGMCLEVLKEDAPEDIYPLHIVDDKDKKLRGSCATFESRTCITRFIRNDENDKNKFLLTYFDAVRKYGETLVIVASQKVRTKLLLGLTTDPQLELSNIQYAMLEMIARSRTHGIITTGQVCSFVGLKESPKSLFYHRKLLMKKQLIKRQLHFQRNKSTTQWGFVFHLPRFYVERPTAVNLMLQKLCQILQNKPNTREQFATLRSEAGIPETTFKKILARGQPLSQFTEVMTVKYRDMYPDADDIEALSAKKTERVLKVVQLVKPFSWNSLSEEGDPDEEDEEFDLSFARANTCDASRLMLLRPIVCQAYDILHDHSPEGLSERELQRLLGITRLDSRSICRYLTRANLVATYMKDKGRQRMTMYVIAEHLHMSQAHQSIVEERQKILDSEIIEENVGQNGEQITEARSLPVTLTNRIIRTGNSNSRKKTPSSRAKSQTKPNDPNGTPSKKNDQDTGFNFYDKNLTARQLSRANFILETVRKQMFVDDIYKIQRALSEKELREGCETKLDKRSVMTLVHKLANNGHIKSINTTLKLGDNVKKLHFVCLPEISQDSHQVQAALQSAKLRLVGLKYTDTKKIYESTKKQPFLKKSNATLSTSDDSMFLDESNLEQEESASPSVPKADWQNKTVEMKFQPSMGKVYGLLPKFCRAQVLHEFLFYLTHDYCGMEIPQQSASCSDEIMIIDDISPAENAQPTAYSDSKDWKMFLPPLPMCEGYPSGWCLVSDVLQRLPVSIFVQIVNIPFKIEGFCDFLDHPIKKHYLITDLPIKLRNSLLMSRRYIFHITEILAKLSFMGLVSFGPQIHKDKDQVYIYVHRMASVIDTTISDPGHYTISPNKEYNLRYHIVDSLTDVYNYWIDMKTVCLNTPLGKKITDHDDTAPKLELRVECKTPEEVADDGRIPGDHCGAGGIDSSLCSYLKRNWQLSRPIEKLHVDYYKKKRQKEKQNSSVPLSLLLNQNNQTDPPADNRRRLNRLPKQPSTSISLDPSDSNSKEMVVSVTMEKSLLGSKNRSKYSMKRPMLLKNRNKFKDSRQPKKHKFDKMDSKDYAAVSLMQKQRATWSSQEDTFLMLCKVASVLMGTNRIACNRALVRDELEKHCPKCESKTSASCLRRFNNLVKNSKTNHYLYVMIAEARQHPSLSSLTKSEHVMGSDEWNQEFLWILNQVISIFTDKKTSMTRTIPSTYEELQEKFTITFSSVELVNLNKCKHVDPKNVVDVYCNAAFNIVLVSVCNNDLHTNWSYHLYKLFKQYPENLLRAVFTRMRSDRIISAQRRHNSNVISHTSHSYQMSVTFKNALNIKRYQSVIFDEGYFLYSQMQEAASNENPYVHISPNNTEGYGMVLQALMCSKMIILRTEIPTQIIDVSDSNKPPPHKKRKDSDTILPYTNVIKDNSEVTFSDAPKTSNATLPPSRLGLHLLRKKSFDTPTFKNIQHAGDCFVVNSCNISARIRNPVRQVIQPLNESVVNKWKISKKIPSDINVDINQFCDDTDIWQYERSQYVAVFNSIQAKKVIGATHKAIYDDIRPIEICPVELKKILNFLCEKNLVVRVGVKSHLYVTCDNVLPWLMRTVVVPKDKKLLAQRDASNCQASPVYVTINNRRDVDAASSEMSKDGSENTDFGGTVIDDSENSNESVDFLNRAPDNPTMGLRKKKKRMKSFVSDNQFVLNEKDCVNVDVVGRPWYKPDGFVNKMTLFTCLESLSSFICSKPGCPEEEIIYNYVPYMQPVYILDLLEMLQECGCITKGFLRKKTKNSGPFSSCTYDLTEEDGLYYDREVFYEPEVDILLKVTKIKSIFNIIK